MRAPALLIAVLLLATAGLAAAQQGNDTNETNETNGTETDASTSSNDTNQNMEADAGNGSIQLPDRESHVPWGGLAVGVLTFAAAVLVSRETDTEQD